MVVHIYLNKFNLVIPSSLDKKGAPNLICETNFYLKFEYQGDAADGPGFFDMTIDLDMIRCYERTFENQETHVLKIGKKAMGGSRRGSRDMHRNKTQGNQALNQLVDAMKKVKSKVETTGSQRNIFADVYENQSHHRRDSPVSGKSPASIKQTHFSKTRSQSHPSNNIISNVKCVFQQRYEIRRCTKHFPEDKANWFSNFRINGNQGRECEIFLPVILVAQLKDMVDVVSSPTVESNDSAAADHTQHQPGKANTDARLDDQFNEIYLFSVPRIIVVVVREYKGEELVRLEAKDLNLHFRTERKEVNEVSLPVVVTRPLPLVDCY